jgi:hypothetical protein
MSSTNQAARSWATGGMVFAGIVLILSGLFQFFQGIAAVAKDDIYVAVPNYVLKLNTSSWGWIHLIIGILVALTGFAVLSGATWARAVGIGLAALSAFTNFFFLPYYPLWALVIIGLDIFVIWSLASAPRRDA